MKYLTFLLLLFIYTPAFSQSLSIEEVGIITLQESVFIGLSLLPVTSWQPAPYVIGGIDSLFNFVGYNILVYSGYYITENW